MKLARVEYKELLKALGKPIDEGASDAGSAVSFAENGDEQPRASDFDRPLELVGVNIEDVKVQLREARKKKKTVKTKVTLPENAVGAKALADLHAGKVSARPIDETE